MAENKKDAKKGLVIDILPRIACVLIAIIIWLYAVYNSNPNYEKSFDGISVTPLFSDMLDDRGLTMYGDIAETIEVVIYGNRGNITTYSKDDIKATVNLIGITEAGKHTSAVSIEVPDGATVKSFYPKEITVQIEDVDVNEVPVKAVPQYNSAYVSGEAVPSVTVATVKGPLAELELVDHVEARPVFEKELTTSMTAVGATLVACTKDGSVVDSSYISIEPATVDVEIPLYDEREIPITVKYTGTALSEIIESATVYPNVIRVRQKINGGVTLADVREIVCEFDEKDLKGLSRNEKFVLPLELPETYENLSDFDKVTVSVNYKSDTTSMVFDCSRFKLDNPEKLSYSVKTDALEICVRLPRVIAQKIAAENSYGDFVFEGSLADIENGKVPLTVNVPDEYEGQICVTGDYSAEVDVKR